LGDVTVKGDVTAKGKGEMQRRVLCRRKVAKWREEGKGWKRSGYIQAHVLTDPAVTTEQNRSPGQAAKGSVNQTYTCQL
jgi:hypothetical protein